MDAWFSSLSSLDQVFVLVGGAGGVLFLLRVILTFVGFAGESGHGGEGGVDSGGDFGGHADSGGDLDQAHDVGTPSGPGHVETHTELSFHLLTVQGLTAFFMMFGLTGLALSRGLLLPSWTAVLGGILAGLGTVWLTDRLFRFFGGLQSSGNTNIHNAVGEIGTVYLTIPDGQVGMVQVAVQGRLLTLDGANAEPGELPTGTRVQVHGVVNNRVLQVKRL